APPFADCGGTQSGRTAGVSMNSGTAASLSSIPTTVLMPLIAVIFLQLDVLIRKKATMGCSASFAKLILFIFNVAFFLFGVASLAVGIWVTASKDELFRFINLLDGQISAGDGKEQIDTVANQSGLIVIAAYVLIGVGVFTLLVGFCGCCGAIKESTCLLYTYAALIGIVLTIEIVTAILAAVFQNRIRGTAEKALFDLQNNYFVSIPTYEATKAKTTGNDAAKAAVTYLLNLAQISFDCCGAQQVNDIKNSSSWLGSDLKFKGRTLVNPMTCCQLKSSSLKTEIKSPAFNWTNFDSYLQDSNCPFTANSPALNQKTCYQGLLDYINKYSLPLIGVCVAIGLIELVGILLACCLANALKNDNAYKS
uniref:Tetraspanin n=1 Tax=Macrostomum lignano TaxID=282301 RepID=A0A1I8HCC8_9PLAT